MGVEGDENDMGDGGRGEVARIVLLALKNIESEEECHESVADVDFLVEKKDHCSAGGAALREVDVAGLADHVVIMQEGVLPVLRGEVLSAFRGGEIAVILFEASASECVVVEVCGGFDSGRGVWIEQKGPVDADGLAEGARKMRLFEKASGWGERQGTVCGMETGESDNTWIGLMEGGTGRAR